MATKDDELLAPVLWEHFAKYGAEAVQRLYEEDPKAYLDLCAKLTPKPAAVQPKVLKDERTFVELLAGAHDAVQQYRRKQLERERAIDVTAEAEDRSSSTKEREASQCEESDGGAETQEGKRPATRRRSADEPAEQEEVGRREEEATSRAGAGQRSNAEGTSAENRQHGASRLKRGSATRPRTRRAKGDSQQAESGNREDEKVDT